MAQDGESGDSAAKDLALVYNPTAQLEKLHERMDEEMERRPAIRFDTPASKFIPELRETFLIVLSKTGIIQRALDACGINRQTYINHKNDDKEFADGIAAAKQTHADHLKSIVYDWAEGRLIEEVWYKGTLVGYKPSRSERMVELAAKSANPEFREKGDQTNIVAGGVLLLPGHAQSMEEWAANAGVEIVNEKEIEDGFSHSPADNA